MVCYPRAKETKEYKVPDGITRISSFAMMLVQKMTSLDLNEVETLETSALYKPLLLETITIPKNLKKGTTKPNKGLQEGAFEECVKLKEYKVTDGNLDFCDIDGVLFSKDKHKLFFYPSAKSGEKYDIPSSVTELGRKAFQGATLLKSMVVPSTVDSVGIEAFRNMINLETVIFEKPEKIKTLNSDVFRACKKLKEVVLPASVTTLSSAFYECEALEKITIPDGSQLKTIKNSAFATNKKLKRFDFKGSCNLETIEPNAFAKAESLEEFKFPLSVKKIGLNAFSGCKNMKIATFEENAAIEEIGAGAFADCGLTSLSIPKNVKKIEKEAFRNCTVLHKIDITEATTEIHPLAFQYCGNLHAINVAKENPKYTSIDGYLLSKNKEKLIIFPPGKANDMFTLLPPSIKEIGEYSFFNCEKLTNVTIPNKVETIGKRAFSLCKNLKTITFLCDKMISPDKIDQAKNTMSFDDGQDAPDMFDHITIHVRKELYDEYNSKDFYKKFKGGIKQSFTEKTEEYIPVSENVVDLLKTTTKDHTFVLPTKVSHNGKDYQVCLIGDYAFQKVTPDVKEVVVKKDIEYIGAQAFVTDIDNKTSTVENVFFIESNPTKKMLSTTRFELDETGNNYNEFAKSTKIYVKKSALETYKDKWNKQVYNIDKHAYETSKLNFIDQIDYKIPGVKISHKYGTFAREFDTDFGIYKREKGTCAVAAFVSKNSDISQGSGDYGTSTYHVRMKSIDLNGGANGDFSYVPAETGVLLKVLFLTSTPKDFYYAIGEKDTKSYTITNNVMKGITVNPKKVTATATSPIYVMQKGLFKVAKSDIPNFTIHKAYAKLEGVPAGAKVVFGFPDDGTTEVNTINATEKVDNLYYNLNGQRVTNPKHGVFIQNGQKIIIK